MIAIKIPHKNNNDNIGDNDDDNIQPEQERIKIPNPKNPKQQIIFQYFKEKHIEITLTSRVGKFTGLLELLEMDILSSQTMRWKIS